VGKSTVEIIELFKCTQKVPKKTIDNSFN